jgi:transposase-like protein
VNPYNTLLKAVQDAHVFERNKIPAETKVVASLLYLSGLSYRAMTYQTRLIGASHVSVFNWVHALKGVVSRVPRKERKIVAIDETVLKIKGRQVSTSGRQSTPTRRSSSPSMPPTTGLTSTPSSS